MSSAVYNFGIPGIRNPASGAARAFRWRSPIIFLVLLSAITLHAADWNTPEQELARKIFAVTGPAAVSLNIQNRSSLAQREIEIISNGLRAALESGGIRLVGSQQAATMVTVALSQNPQYYVWVAEIHQGSGAPIVVMVSIARPERSEIRNSFPLTLQSSRVFSQPDRMLDILSLDDAAAHIAVLNSESIVLYRLKSGDWQAEQSLRIRHDRAWPRDLRGRLVAGKDHLLDAYLPGVFCRSTNAAPFALECHDSDDPWPLIPTSFGQTTLPFLNAFFAPARNFFTGALSPGLGKSTNVGKFYSAATISREKNALWLFASIDGQIHVLDGMMDQIANATWGTDIASVRTNCGAGWQVLATGPSEQAGDSVRAYEFPDRDPVAVSAAVDFSGEITALWTESKGDTAIAITKNRETGSYEAFRLAVACDQ
jgi:hypothetical protein